jgi:uracil-DNA glycosylase
MTFSTDCRSYPRLAGFLDQVREAHPDCYSLIVGLAPGLHGANRSGRFFSGNSEGYAL